MGIFVDVSLFWSERFILPWADGLPFGHVIPHSNTKVAELSSRGKKVKTVLRPEVIEWLEENTFGKWGHINDSIIVHIAFEDERDEALFKLFWHE